MNIMLGPLVLVITISILPHGHTKAVPKNYLIETDSNEKYGSDYNLGLDEIIKFLSKSVGGLLQKIGSDYDSGKAITKNYPIETDSSEASGKKYGSDSDSGEAATETYLIETDSKESPDNTASSFSRKN